MEQINLNRPELWPRPTPFAARTMAVLLGVLIAVVAGLYAYQSHRVDRQRQALQQAEDRRDRVEGELKGAEEAHQERREQLEALRSEVAGLQERVATLREAERALRTRLKAAGSKGQLVRALGRARARQDGVWLTRFRLEGVNPVRLRLEGKGARPEAIPRYLQAVADQKPYRGGFFRDLNAQSDGDEVLSFHSEAVFPVVEEADQ